MSTTTAVTPDGATPALDDGCTPQRRVRHELRDAAAVMLFSAATSSLLAVVLMLLVRSGS